MREWLGLKPRHEWLAHLFFLEVVTLAALVVNVWRWDQRRAHEERGHQETERGRQAGHDNAMAEIAEAQHSVMRSVADSVRSLQKITEDMSEETSRTQRWAIGIGVATALVSVVLGAVVGPLTTRWLSPDDPVIYTTCVGTSGAVAALVPEDSDCPPGLRSRTRSGG